MLIGHQNHTGDYMDRRHTTGTLLLSLGMMSALLLVSGCGDNTTETTKTVTQ